MQKWEYKHGTLYQLRGELLGDIDGIVVESLCDTLELLNAFGNQGWEMVSVLPSATNTWLDIYYFKRQLPEEK